MKEKDMFQHELTTRDKTISELNYEHRIHMSYSYREIW